MLWKALDFPLPFVQYQQFAVRFPKLLTKGGYYKVRSPEYGLLIQKPLKQDVEVDVKHVLLCGVPSLTHVGLFD